MWLFLVDFYIFNIFHLLDALVDNGFMQHVVFSKFTWLKKNNRNNKSYVIN